MTSSVRSRAGQSVTTNGGTANKRKAPAAPISLDDDSDDNSGAANRMHLDDFYKEGKLHSLPIKLCICVYLRRSICTLFVLVSLSVFLSVYICEGVCEACVRVCAIVLAVSGCHVCLLACRVCL